MKTILSHILFCSDTAGKKRDLYVRTSGAVTVEKDKAVLTKGAALSFFTYFNAFFYSSYALYTDVSHVSPYLLFSGKLTVRLICRTLSQQKIVFQETVSGERRSVSFPACRLDALPPGGALYLELESLEDGSVLYEGGYETSCEPNREVCVAAIICTYRREAYVLRNVELLREQIWENPDCTIRQALDLLVVDNGKTLQMEDAPHLRVLQNKNYGGSGGFTRGMMEALAAGRYSHMLLMDDDISFEPEIFFRTVQILRFERQGKRPLWIGAQMLSEKQPAMQYESGACFQKGRIKGFGRHLDLSEERSLLLNEEQRQVQYTAWWFCCMPAACAAKTGLPLPFFFKGDDLEYGIRNQPAILLMNGIGVWHAAFEEKYSPYLEYYIKRNELVVSAVHRLGGAWQGAEKLVRAAGKAFLTGNLKTVAFLQMAYQDYLKGPSFFFSLDDESHHLFLLQKNREPEKKRLLLFLTAPFRVACLCVRFLHQNAAAAQQYRDSFPQLTSQKFWAQRLGLNHQKEGERKP